jgi:biopolymer transport protein TolQ
MHWSLDLSSGSTSPLALLLHADIVVQIVMAGLLIASIWTWAIIIGFATKVGATRRKIDKFERDFWKAEDIDAFYKLHGDDELPVARVFAAGVSEWRRSTAGGVVDRDGIRERLATAMGSAVAGEADKLADRLNILATVGSVAPFVGLFGTVWGIMSSFTGIAEALFATAIGLFAAIPAVIAYNRFSHGVNRIEAKLTRFADGFHTTLSRQLEAKR